MVVEVKGDHVMVNSPSLRDIFETSKYDSTEEQSWLGLLYFKA